MGYGVIGWIIRLPFAASPEGGIGLHLQLRIILIFDGHLFNPHVTFIFHLVIIPIPSPKQFGIRFGAKRKNAAKSRFVNIRQIAQ